ncbi:MAG: RluA family pseudouridine synthase [Tenuifilaceae bacterium]|jgi:tRNA pseudouridine32 synthase/23S rRNA pseudouridine746 synthase/23S rRNA pseudouridine1911/1915/1917 synthase|nr:RluA family pseudouridine synthase [Tenuifilaceae bacterium]
MPEGRLGSRKHQPKGLEILYEDHDIIVVDKASGLLSMGTDRDKQNTAYYHLTNYVKRGNPRSHERVFIVHRLDRDTSGLLVFAKSENAKYFLQDNWSDFRKRYVAVVLGSFKDKEGVIESFLAESKSFRVYSTSDRTIGKYAKTGYWVVKENERFSLLDIELFTGRKNQIRVHLADKGHPVLGDKVYGEPDKSIKRLALHSYSLTIIHPYTHKEMTFETGIPTYFNQLMNVKSSKPQQRRSYP